MREGVRGVSRTCRLGGLGGGGGGCITQANSQERADSATWAAMGAVAGRNQTGWGGGRGGHPS